VRCHVTGASSYEVTTLRPRGVALGDTKVSGRRVTSKAPLAHLVGGSGRSKTSPTTILQDTHSLEVEFSEVPHSPGPIQQIVLCRDSEMRSLMYIRNR
jgi:hypothetical protein